jgi:hypothetical protein
MTNIPRIRIAHLPTPIEEMPRLSIALGGPRLFVKRDDQTGLAFGGNKTRKLEFLLAEAESQGARTIITAGAVQSNHCRQTAAAAARFGFDCILVLFGDKPDRPTANLMLDQLFNAEIVWTDRSHRDEVLRDGGDPRSQAIPCSLWWIESDRCPRICLRNGGIYSAGHPHRLDYFRFIFRGDTGRDGVRSEAVWLQRPFIGDQH